MLFGLIREMRKSKFEISLLLNQIETDKQRRIYEFEIDAIKV